MPVVHLRNVFLSPNDHTVVAMSQKSSLFMFWRDKQRKTAAQDVGYTLRRIHTLAVAVIAACILLGGFEMDKALTRNARDAETINIAGAQRMLSQRIAALILLTQEAPIGEKEQYRQRLQQSLTRMKSGHDYLTGSNGSSLAPADKTPALKTHYGEDGTNLTQRVDFFIARGQSFLDQNAAGTADPNVDISLSEFLALDSLLKDLDTAVSLHEVTSKQKIKGAEGLLKRTILLALVVLLFVAIFVFRPIARRTTGALETSAQKLSERSELLSQSLQIADMGYWFNSLERANEIWISKELARLYGIDEVDRWFSLDEIKKRVEDLNSVKLSSAAQTCRAKGDPQYIETSLRLTDGTIVETSTSIAAQFDRDGNVVSITGVVRDITQEVKARRTIEATVQQLEEQGKDLKEAQNLGNTAIWQMPLGARSMELNEDVYRLMRYDFAKAKDYRKKSETGDDKSTHLNRILIDDSFQRLMEKSAEVFKTGESGEITVAARRGDGSIADLSIRIKLQRGPDGKPTGFFGTMQDVSEQKEAERQLEQLAYYDHLTGLSNRTLCMRRLERICQSAKPDSEMNALVLIDLDDFKEINDSLGHQAGDDVLCETGKRLTQIAGPRNLVARLGGDEFAIIITDRDHREGIGSLVSEILASLSLPIQIGDAEAHSSGSAGVAILPSDTSNASEALRFADLALYDAKESGRNRMSFFAEDMSDRLQSRLSLARDLRAAVAKEELNTHFQPIVSAASGRVTGFETLMRWHHSEKGWIPPSEFIPIAESSHLIGDIGAFALKDACAQALEINRHVEEDIEIAVNVSAAQLWHGDVEKMVAKALTNSGLPPHLLCVELTESVFVGDGMDRVETLLKRLKARGVQLALDDFGTGYSSLSYLNHLPFDKLKIDRSFVVGSDTSQKRFQVLEGIVSLAKGLGMKAVAEGVETATELKAVHSLDCDFIQGFYFGRPAPQCSALQAIESINAAAQAPAVDDIVREAQTLDAVQNTALSLQKQAS